MNLDSCTPGQRQIITTLDRPLMVSAGAGSGKTFTLTQRIAYALEEPQGPQGTPFAEDISDVMAITFTKKAAAELKSRVKRRLIEAGKVEQALKVDDALITTIHGMCSRMLREHALELGIDPAFTILSETDAAACRTQAFDDVMEALQNGGDAEMRAFVNAVGVYATGANSASIEGWVSALTDRVLALPAGFDALVEPQGLADPAALLREMVELGETFLACLEGCAKKPLKADEANREAMERALEQVAAYLDTARHCGFADEDFDAKRYAETFFAFPPTSAKYRTKDSDPTFFAEYRQEYARLAAEVEGGFAARELRFIARLARSVDEAYQRIKGPARLDNTDLLRLTHAALTERPDLAEAYRGCFRMIMVDEFQDTDELQVALISALAQPQLANVCTVGDAQQSIYRFRGADVNVFYDYRDRLDASGADACFVSLPDNFRSHADVLAFVDCIFAQPTVFGDRFLSLAPKGAVNDVPDPLFADRPRIQMALFEHRSRVSSKRDAQLAAAERIASHFADLRAGGAEAGDMVILLGKMSQADLYAEALRKEGFECVVAGGSTFSDAPEPALVASVLSWLADPLDDAALYNVLASPLFCLDADSLLHLATRTDHEGRHRCRPLSEGVLSWRKERTSTLLAEEQVDQLDFAVVCLDAARAALGQGMEVAVRALVRASGWLIRLETEGAAGQAAVGNLEKALRMVAEIDGLGLGPVGGARRFSDDLASLKLTPGTLSTASSDYVRIMTVHASKGLEFAHVALADLTLAPKSSNAVVENIAGRTYATVNPQATSAMREQVTKILGYADPIDGTAEEVVEAVTPGQRAVALKEYRRNQELSEARRLLYVALTRASKSLLCTVAYQGKKEINYEGKGVLEDLYTALSWDPSPEAPVQTIPYGGSAPLRLEYTLVAPADDEMPDAKATCANRPFAIPANPPQPEPYSYALASARDDVFSYSSLSASHASDTGEEEAFVSLGVVDEDATALGTAFHLLCQRSLIDSAGALPLRPDSVLVSAQVRRQGLTAQQAGRLDAALDRWFASDELARLAVRGTILSEVPFMTALGDGLYLEGEIDALVIDGEGAAWLVDYKTGGSSAEEPAELVEKHRLQAQCYALALLAQGCTRVGATFVRVEQPDLADPTQPQTVRYSFGASDQAALEQEILEQHRSAGSSS